MKRKITEIAQIKRINADPNVGLTAEQVQSRYASGAYNKPVEPPSKSVWEIISDNLFTYFNLIFLIISAALIFAKKYRDLTFLPIIAANTLIGIFQELKAKRVLDKLSVMNAPVTAVIRDGKELSVPSCDVVLDDIAVFRAGDHISADAVVIDGNAAVNEALLTGESDEIIKKSGDRLMSGSFVISGSCRSRLEKVGSESYISQLTLQAKKAKSGEQSELIRSLNKIVGIAGIMVIPIGAVLFLHQYFFGERSAADSIQSMAAAVIGMIPEGLFLLASTALVISTMRLASEKVLVHDMKCIEALARVDTLCVDKTGTITEPEMSVSEVIPIQRTADELVPIISDLAEAQEADNPTMAAMKKYFRSPSGKKALSSSGFSSEFKYSGVVLESGAYILGAPEFIISDTEKYSHILKENCRKGRRVLAFAEYSGIPDGKALTAETRLLCFIVMENPIRKNAPETFGFFAEQGVDIKVISGDDPLTVSETARQAGIKNSENFIDASALKSDEQLEVSAEKYTVFGRVTPEQKLKLVRALKNCGRTVAMTGDGVNDVLALKEADCSVAMASGSEAAAQASQLVLLDSDFAKMPSVVLEGRRVVNNLERSGSLFLVKNIFSLALALTAIFSGIAYPLKPANISLIGMFTIGLPGFLLSQIPNKELIRGKFIKNILLKALPAGLTDAVMVAAMVFSGKVFHSAHDDIATASTILLAVVGMMILFRISRPMNGQKWLIWLICGLLLIFSMIFFRGFFSISAMTAKCIGLCIVFSVTSLPMLRLFTLLTEKISRVFSSHKQ